LTKLRAWAADGPREEFRPYEMTLAPLGADEVEIDVEYCGVCHSDLSMWANEWRRTVYPFVGGHEVVGRVRAVGPEAKGLEPGARVGLGWYSRSHLSSRECLAGDHHLSPGNEATIVGRPGGFADVVRCQWSWAIPLPDDLGASTAGPLFCGGITVFNPIASYVRPTDRVGVVGIGGLGHLAVQFLNRWGCEVTAFTSSPDKADEARLFGARHVLSSRDAAQWKAARGRFDVILSTVAVGLDWNALMATLAPRGRLHIVGAVPEPISLPVSAMMGGQKALSASPVGSPADTARMIDFCARHAIAPLVEEFPMSRINDAFARLESGKARYRIVLKNDFR
jgi:uncharacterized zinc-type alcohol dehydrogenase-like protein